MILKSFIDAGATRASWIEAICFPRQCAWACKQLSVHQRRWSASTWVHLDSNSRGCDNFCAIIAQKYRSEVLFRLHCFASLTRGGIPCCNTFIKLRSLLVILLMSHALKHSAWHLCQCHQIPNSSRWMWNTRRWLASSRRFVLRRFAICWFGRKQSKQSSLSACYQHIPGKEYVQTHDC
jgi:hypothetical protein